MILKSLRQALPATLIFLGLALLASCTSRDVSEPVVNKPFIQGIAPESVEDIEISMRPFSDAAWRVRLKRETGANWKLVERSDLPGVTDRADSAFVEHLLSTLMTFTTETKAEKGPDPSFGFTPYRVEIQLNKKTVIQLGDPTETTGIFFRRDAHSSPYIGRGALVAFLGHMQSPNAFQLKSAYLGRFEEYETLELEKTEGKDRGRWSFVKKNNRWTSTATPSRPLSDEQQSILERIFRQRIVGLATPAPVLPKKPDWIFHIGGEGSLARIQEISIYFILDQIFGMNAQRGNLAVEFYPDLAGSLRAFTQSEFTRVKSVTK